MRIAIVNGVRLATHALVSIIRESGEHELAWCAENGEEAVSRCETDLPDLILMDLATINGVVTIRRIMLSHPCPILIVTASVQQHYDVVFEAMGAGAIDVISASELYGGAAQGAELLLKKIALLGFFRHSYRSVFQGDLDLQEAAQISKHLVVIGCSSGGPTAVASLLTKLPSKYLAPIVVIQHIDAQFAPSLARWLDEKTTLQVKAAEEGEFLRTGCVYIAAKDKHLMMNRECRLYYNVEPHETYYRPSVDVFFYSVATHWHYPVTAVLLTGMGGDGAHGLLKLRRTGAYTVAQDEQTSAVYGMPKVAAELGAAVDILSLEEISRVLRESAFENAVECKSRLSGGVQKIS